MRWISGLLVALTLLSPTRRVAADDDVAAIVGEFVVAFRTKSSGLDDARKKVAALNEKGLLELLRLAGKEEKNKQEQGVYAKAFMNAGGLYREDSQAKYSELGLTAMILGLRDEAASTRLFCLESISSSFVKPQDLPRIIESIQKMAKEDAKEALRTRANAQLSYVALEICRSKLQAVAVKDDAAFDFDLIMKIGEPSKPALERLIFACEKWLADIVADPERQSLDAIRAGLGGAPKPTMIEIRIQHLMERASEILDSL